MQKSKLDPRQAEAKGPFMDYHSRVSSTLVGISTIDQVRASLRAFGSPADPELMSEVKTILGPVANIVWPSGKPENN